MSLFLQDRDSDMWSRQCSCKPLREVVPRLRRTHHHHHHHHLPNTDFVEGEADSDDLKRTLPVHLQAYLNDYSAIRLIKLCFFTNIVYVDFT